jgi:hypothetical protein
VAEYVATVIDWFGPYTGTGRDDLLKKARKKAQNDYGNGLYAAVGHGIKVRPGPRTLLYMGVGAPLRDRLKPGHHKLSNVSISSLWLGEVSVAGIPGRRKKKIAPHLDVVEWASVYFLEIPFNERKRVKPPPVSCVVVNKWWGTDYKTEADRPTAGWADVIEYDAVKGAANLVWFGSRGRIKATKVPT